MKNTNLQLLNKKLTDTITLVLKEFHEQYKGVRVTSMVIQHDELSPPGIEYSIRANAQVTYAPEPEPQKETPSA